jgi:hypothetical protein
MDEVITVRYVNGDICDAKRKMYERNYYLQQQQNCLGGAVITWTCWLPSDCSGHFRLEISTLISES